MKLIRLLKRLRRAQPLRLVASICAIALAGLLEGAAVASLAPLLDLATVHGTVPTPSDVLGASVAAVLAVLHLPFDLTSCLMVTLALALAGQVVTLAQSRLIAGSVAKLQVDLRTRLYRALIAADWPFFVSTKTSDLTATLLVFTLRAGEAYRTAVQFVGTALVALLYLAIAARVSWLMTVIIGVGGLAILFLLRKRTARGGVLGESMNDTDLDLWAAASEHLAAAKAVKAYGLEDVSSTEISQLSTRFGGLQYQIEMNSSWLRFLYESISVVAVLCGVFVAVKYTQLSVGLVVVFLVLFYRLSPRVSALQSLYATAMSFAPALESIDELMTQAARAQEALNSGVASRFSESIVLDGIDFEYCHATPVLSGVSLEIRCGELTAIVGPSGSGKTTVIDLVLGLLTPRAGEIRVDGVPFRDLDLTAWRGRIGYVAQDGSIFHDTIAANIRMGDPSADDDAVREAARLAFADEFIVQMPDAYDTVVGDRGVRMSGGQRQRIALARALVRRPEILVLDEATSALDAESEEKIQEAVRRLSRAMTVVTVTHRLATVRDADVIHFLEAGRLVESGSWAELVEAHGRFDQMQSQQSLASDPG